MPPAAAAASCDQQVPLMWGETGAEEAQPLPEGAASGGSENGRRGPKATDLEQQRPGSGPVRRSTRRQSGTSVERPHNKESAPRRASGAALTEDPAAAAAAGASEKPSSASLEAEKGTVSFEEARTRVWSIGLGRPDGPGAGEQCWLKWCSRNGRHRVMRGLPVRPHEEYPGEWKGYDDFVLGWKAAEAQQEEQREEEEEEEEKSQGEPGAEASGDEEDFKATEEEEDREEGTPAAMMAPDEGQEEQEKSSAAGKGLQFLPFQKTRDVVRGLHLRSAYPSCKASTAWSNWYRNNMNRRRELHLPSQPDVFYKEDGFDWDDFVGGGAAEREEDAAEEAALEEEDRQDAAEEAAEAVHEEEEDSPAAEEPHEETPDASHPGEGSEQQPKRKKSGANGKKSKWMPFKEAQAKAWTFGLRSAYPSNTARTAWEKWCQANGPRRLQLRLPTMPSSIYGKEEGFDLDYFVFGPKETGGASGASMNPGRSTRKRPRQREGSRDEDRGEEEAQEAPERPRRRSGSANRAAAAAAAAAAQPTPELQRQVDDTLGVVLALRTRGQRVAVNLPLEESPQRSKARGSSAVLPRGKGAPAFPDLDGGAAWGLETLTLVAEEPKEPQEGLLEAPQSPAAAAEESHGGEGGDAAAPAAVAEASDGGEQEDAPEADLRAPTETTPPTTGPEGTPHPTEADGAPEPTTAAAAAVPPPVTTPVTGGGAPKGVSQTLWELLSPSAPNLHSEPGLIASFSGVFKALGERFLGRSPAPGPSKAPGLHGPTAAEASRAEDSTDGIFASLAPLDRSIAEEEPEHLSRRQLQAGVSSPLVGAAGEQETAAAAAGCSPSPMPWHQAYGDGSGSLSQQQKAKQGGSDPAQRLRFDNPALDEEAAREERRRSLRSGTVIAATPESSFAHGSRKSKRGRQSIESVPSEVDSDTRRTRRRSGRLSQQHQGL